MTQGSTGSSRRTVLATGAAALVAAGCSDSNSSDTGATERSPAASAPASSPAAATSAAQSAMAQELTSTSDIPVGGGKVFAEHKIVVTQPKKGEFKAFSAVCTHQGCTVAKVADGTIDCPCHGSMFHIADGTVAQGPATHPLAPKKIEVAGNSIRLT
ncbi:MULTISPECIES: Rieske (2Fe-2S) protein [unclassified Streptomyces]|uniref:Rieske (2Fe-2S) protein n=1 Tax=unclassified Streptomyces TaxID=2593676 RepID=UPI0003AA7B41|nr:MULTISPECIES: Rieske (2Fe-2S) protein [unclassified Streptomyces]MYX31837.1 Rieske 2Fe-2S domain-containing protein [Streptomyces sp. SID8381]